VFDKADAVPLPGVASRRCIASRAVGQIPVRWENELRVFASLADAKALLNERRLANEEGALCFRSRAAARGSTATPERRRPRHQKDQRRQGGAGSPFPCRAGKLRVKIFSRFAPYRKVVFDQNLARDSSAESKARQGTGRETQKSSDRRLASTDHCYHSNYEIDVFACPLYGAELRCGKRTAGVVRAARGGTDGRSPVSETKRDYQVSRVYTQGYQMLI
jgi:hypothetical protein